MRIQNSGEALKVLLMETSGTSENYVALSHCWGDPKNATGKVPKTEKNDLDVYKSTGIPISTLTKTFQEAIDITQKLGVEYIWIDSLCIVQNDREDWRIESQKMGDIYGNAYLVIAATHAENGAYGLHRERISRRFEVVTPTGQTIKAQVFEKAHHDVWKKGEQFGYAAELPLFSRAWAFQERLLARRVVHYTPTELVWECSTCIDCECGDLRNPNTAWPEFGIGKNMKTRYGEVVTDSNIARLEFWHVICAQYSARKLTYPTDRLPALSSVAKRIDMPDVLGRYLAGIWECNLPKGLFWWSEFTNSALHPPAIKTHWRDKTHQIPTWSWLSIEGRVSTWGMIEACLIVVRVVVISYTVSSNDDYGTCEEGIITLEGVGVPIEVVDAKRSGGPSDKEVRLIGEEHSVDFYTDENPFEYSEQDSKTGELLAFLFGYTNMHSQAMILKQVPGTNNRYERLGIANPCPHGWFAGQTTREIELV